MEYSESREPRVIWDADLTMTALMRMMAMAMLLRDTVAIRRQRYPDMTHSAAHRSRQPQQTLIYAEPALAGQRERNRSCNAQHSLASSSMSPALV